MRVTVGTDSFELVALDRGGYWTAHALRATSGERFGVEMRGSDRQDAEHRLLQWLEWQQAHVSALAALQQAERAYHRATADAAFGGDAARLRAADAIEAVNTARQALDDVRARRPQM